MTHALALHEPPDRYRWSAEEFVRAFDAGVFERRVELLDGVKVTSATLPSERSLPDPDLWVRKKDAQPVRKLGARLAAWAASDVLLVVEVSDESVATDLGFKAQLYAAAGYPEYWAVTKDGVYVHRDPSPQGYGERVRLGSGEQLPVPYAPGTTLDVAQLISVD